MTENTQMHTNTSSQFQSKNFKTSKSSSYINNNKTTIYKAQ